MKRALITSAHQGIGSGFLEYLLEKGFQVFSATRKDIDQQIKHPNLEWLHLELTDNKSIESAFKLVSKKADCIDLLVNNAGVNKVTATNNHKEKVSNLSDLDRSMLIDMFNVNAIAPIIILQKFLPLLKSKPSFVINISSSRASFHDEFENSSGNYGYRASKIALNMLTFCCIKDLPNHIKIFSVHPGSVYSQMNPLGELTPKQCAENLLFITENWKEDWNGKFLRFDGSLYPL